jgi:ADP-heptose:LPS heptosyltransferase
MTRLKNFFIKIVVRTLKKWIKQHQTEKRILIVTTTALGDTLWATPAIEALRKSFPHSFIAALTSPIGAKVLQNNPHLSKIYTLHKFSYRLWKDLYKEQFSTILLFHASQRLTLPFCALLGAKELIGTASINKGLDSLLTEAIPPQYEHEVKRRCKMVEKIGGQIKDEPLSFFLNSKIEKKPGRWIALHPGAKDIFKRWPAKNFIELGQKLKEKLNCEILITGTSAEENLMQEIKDGIPGAHLVDPKLSLHAFASLLHSIDGLICNDTGPFHLACALNKPVLGIYSATDPNLCGSYLAPKARIIYHPKTCEPCLRKKCRAPFCLLQIGTCEVLTAALKLFT